MISCPKCGLKVSTMAGTCPHCGIEIAGHIWKCPSCGIYSLDLHEECPHCHTKPAATQEEITEKKVQKESRKVRSRRRWRLISLIVKVFLFLALAGATGYFLYLHHLREQEEAEFSKLENVTNPAFYKDFLDRYPHSQHYRKVHDKMLLLQKEAEDWQLTLRDGRKEALEAFLSKHPGSIQIRICRDKIDSLDWVEALNLRTDSAINAYLLKHPEGIYLNAALETKREIAKAKSNTIKVK